jgi:hypothetical protein
MKSEIYIEIGPHLLEAIKEVIKATSEQNKRNEFFTMNPGRAVQKAFNIDAQALARIRLRTAESEDSGKE